MAYIGEPVPKNPNYPSGKWAPDPLLQGDYSSRNAYLKELKLLKGRGLIVAKAIACVVLLISGIVGKNPLHPKVLLWGGGIGTAVWIFRYFTEYQWVRNGCTVEGLITAISEDGIDRLYTIYYEHHTGGYQIQSARKVESRAR
jgi:hypothetical protein